MPKLSDTMTYGTLTSWLKKVGDRVEIGDTLAEIETDKSSMDLENFDEGVILKIYVEAGDQVPIGKPLCLIGETEESQVPEPSQVNLNNTEEAPLTETEPLKQALEEADQGVATSSNKDRIKISPLAKRMAEEKGIPIHQIKGSGPGGRIVKEDVLKSSFPAVSASQVDASAEKDKNSSGNKLQFEQSPQTDLFSKDLDEATLPRESQTKAEVLSTTKTSSKKSASNTKSPFDVLSAQAKQVSRVEIEGISPSEIIAKEAQIPLSSLRNVLARRMVEAKTEIPHFYLTSEVDVGPMLDLRIELNNALAALPTNQGGSGKFTVNDFILKATAQAIRSIPAINCSWQGDSIAQHARVHLAFGVAVDHGLVTPVVRDAHLKSLRQISIEAKYLVGKARNKKLTPDEMAGSTFTVTNLGMFDIEHFYGIVNPPNAAILSIGSTVKKPVVNAQDEIVIGQKMNLGLSGDHRVIDGAIGAQFLAALKSFIERPTSMML